MPKAVNNLDVDSLAAAMETARNTEATRCGHSLDKSVVDKMVSDEFLRLISALDTDSEAWKSLIPGRPILKRFAAHIKQNYGTLKRLYILAARTSQPDPFVVIREIFAEFARR